MRLSIILLLGIAVMATSSCVRKCSGSEGATIYFRGYDSASLEEVTIRKFTKGTGLLKSIDSITVSLSAANVPVTYYDSVNGYVKWPSTPIYWHGNYSSYVANIDPAIYDYEIRVSNTKQIFRITDVAYSDAKSPCSGSSSGADACECANALEAYKLNDSLVVTGNTGYVNPRNYGARVELHR